MTTDEARDVIATALGRVAPDVDIATLDPTAELQIEADLDSMDHLRLIELVSSAIGRDIPERDYPRTASVEQFVEYVVALTTG